MDTKLMQIGIFKLPKRLLLIFYTFTTSTKQRLQDLEARRKEIQLSIVQQQISKPTYTREEIENFFEKAKFVDINKAKDRKFIADYFVNAVILHNDKLLLYLNYKENGISIPINELSISSDTLCATPPVKTVIILVTVFSFIKIHSWVDESNKAIMGWLVLSAKAFVN